MSANICFLSPANPAPIGGVKVIYRLAEMIQQHYFPQYTSDVCSVRDIRFSCSWFEHNTKMRDRYLFDPVSDFLIVPEYMVGYVADALSSARLRYAIFVQNGYMTCSRHSREVLEPSYIGADFIISISDDTTNCLELLFPKISNKTIRYRYAIDSCFFYDSGLKTNLITYMPRKMSAHSEFVVAALSAQLPKTWTTAPIDKVSEAEVARVFRRSRIFLAFSDQEGLAVPPLEAALSGNLVIGYHGEGGREYWTPPLFFPIEKGNLIEFSRRVLEVVSMLDKARIVPDIREISTLRRQYSVDAQKPYLASIIDLAEHALSENREATVPQHLVDLSQELTKPFLPISRRQALGARIHSLFDKLH